MGSVSRGVLHYAQIPVAAVPAASAWVLRPLGPGTSTLPADARSQQSESEEDLP